MFSCNWSYLKFKVFLGVLGQKKVFFFTFLGVSSPFPFINLSPYEIKHFLRLKDPKNTLNFKYDQSQKKLQFVLPEGQDLKYIYIWSVNSMWFKPFLKIPNSFRETEFWKYYLSRKCIRSGSILAQKCSDLVHLNDGIYFKNSVSLKLLRFFFKTV